MALAAVETLSDDDTTIELHPDANEKVQEKDLAKAEAKRRHDKTLPKAKITPKPKPKQSSKSPKKPSMKRPASAASLCKHESVMKRPAANTKDPNYISAGKSKYKSNGVWCVKLKGKEVVRASWLQHV